MPDLPKILPSIEYLDSLEVAAAILTPHLEIVWRSNNFERFSMIKKTIGAHFWEAIGEPEILGPAYDDPFQTALRTGKRTSTTLRVRENTYFEVEVAPIESDQEYKVDLFHLYKNRLFIIIRDITNDILFRQRINAIYIATQDLSTFNAIDFLHADQHISQLKDAITNHIVKLLKAEHFVIRLLDDSSRVLKLFLSFGMPQDIINTILQVSPEGNGISGFTAATGKSYLCEFTEFDPLFLENGSGAKSSLTVPIVSRDLIIGTLHLESKEEQSFSEEDLNYTEFFARGLASTFQLEQVRQFIQNPSVVEVFLTECLSEQDIGCYHFHLGEMHHAGVAENVFFIGHRHEAGGSVLRFQAQSYKQIYEILPHLLAPFRQSNAIEWEQTVAQIPEEDRTKAISMLAKAEISTPRRWHFAERLADVFSSFRNAKVYQIREGRSRALRIEVFTNEEIAKKLNQIQPVSEDDDTGSIWVSGKTVNLQIKGAQSVGDKISVGGDNFGVTGHKSSQEVRKWEISTQRIANASKSDDSVRQSLEEAYNEIQKLTGINETDKEDVEHNFDKLIAELEKPSPELSRLKRLWLRIEEIAPTVATLIKSAEGIANIIGM